MKKEGFEEIYLACRQQEHRLYGDEVVKNLPQIFPTHPHYREWKIRLHSAQRLRQYVRDHRIKSLLDLGCGNGWLANFLSNETAVVAVDVQHQELEQGRRLFPRVRFVQGDIMEDSILPGERFQMILLASVIQYFPDLQMLVDRLGEKLDTHGEIHIVDSPVYKNREEAVRAKARSQAYYDSMRSNMVDHYHHHCRSDLNRFDTKWLYDPTSIWVRFSQLWNHSASPFPWICIKGR